jgi:pyruvate-ferredoxin/flavodoxin oxidoreductase
MTCSGYDIKANPKYGSEKKGQPTTYYLAAAPNLSASTANTSLWMLCYLRTRMYFKHTNALAGLKKGGVFIIQSEKKNLMRYGPIFRSLTKNDHRQ